MKAKLLVPGAIHVAAEMWNEKHVIGEWRGFKLVGNTPNNPTYFTVWTPENKRVGTLETRDMRIKGEDFLNVRNVMVDPKYRGQGLGYALYRALLDNLGPQFAGICAYLPDQANKRQVPKIWKRLGGQPHPENSDYVIVRR